MIGEQSGGRCEGVGARRRVFNLLPRGGSNHVVFAQREIIVPVILLICYLNYVRDRGAIVFAVSLLRADPDTGRHN